jgi:hypothetical protein
MNVKKVIIKLAIIILILLGIGLLPIARVQTHQPIGVPVVNDVPLGEILTGTRISTNLYPEYSGCRQIQMLFATYARTNTISLSITVLGKTQKNQQHVLLSTILDGKMMHDNSFIMLDLPPNNDSSYNILISSNGSPGNAITMWTVPQSAIRMISQSIAVEPLNINGSPTKLYPIVNIYYPVTKLTLFQAIGMISIYVSNSWALEISSNVVMMFLYFFFITVSIIIVEFIFSILSFFKRY